MLFANCALPASRIVAALTRTVDRQKSGGDLGPNLSAKNG